MIKQGISENQVEPIYIGIGSNLGKKRENIDRAKSFLTENNIKIIKVSSYYESFSWPDKKKPKFLNIVISVVTSLKPFNLLNKCKEIEAKFGSRDSIRNSPRKCDIDIIDYGRKKINKKILLPHPSMHNRNFVLLPLFEIDKNWIHPVSKKHIKTLIFSLSDRDIRSIKQI